MPGSETGHVKWPLLRGLPYSMRCTYYSGNCIACLTTLSNAEELEIKLQFLPGENPSQYKFWMRQLTFRKTGNGVNRSFTDVGIFVIQAFNEWYPSIAFYQERPTVLHFVHHLHQRNGVIVVTEINQFRRQQITLSIIFKLFSLDPQVSALKN